MAATESLHTEDERVRHFFAIAACDGRWQFVQPTRANAAVLVLQRWIVRIAFFQGSDRSNFGRVPLHPPLIPVLFGPLTVLVNRTAR